MTFSSLELLLEIGSKLFFLLSSSSIPGWGRTPGGGQRRAWQPTPVFLAGEAHGQKSLAGRSQWGGKESDTTEAT